MRAEDIKLYEMACDASKEQRAATRMQKAWRAIKEKRESGKLEAVWRGDKPPSGKAEEDERMQGELRDVARRNQAVEEEAKAEIEQYEEELRRSSEALPRLSA